MRKSVLAVSAVLDSVYDIVPGPLNYSLFKSISEVPIDIRAAIIMTPKIKSMFANSIELSTPITVTIEEEVFSAEISQFSCNGITTYGISSDRFFNSENLFNQTDDPLRYIFFAKSILSMIEAIDFAPDIIHCNDWPTGFIPFYIKTNLHNSAFSSIKTFFTFSNIVNQGVFDRDPIDGFDFLPKIEEGYNLDYFGQVNYLQTGIYYADQCSTVSPSYLQDICQEMYGSTLDETVKNRLYCFNAVIPGIDYADNNPLTDSEIFVQYDIHSFAKKNENKLMLQQELGLPVSSTTPLLFFNSGLRIEKGIELLQLIFDDLMKSSVQLIIMDSRQEDDNDEETVFRNFFAHASLVNSHSFVYLPYYPALSKKLFAAADIYLMPSLFEPCGFGQLQAMSYGTVPIVRNAAGIKDTVSQYDPKTRSGTGFLFNYCNERVLLSAIRDAVSTFSRPDEWRTIVENCMSSRLPVHKSAQDYVSIYNKL